MKNIKKILLVGAGTAGLTLLALLKTPVPVYQGDTYIRFMGGDDSAITTVAVMRPYETHALKYDKNGKRIGKPFIYPGAIDGGITSTYADKAIRKETLSDYVNDCSMDFPLGVIPHKIYADAKAYQDSLVAIASQKNLK